jgi:hypothetical protein
VSAYDPLLANTGSWRTNFIQCIVHKDTLCRSSSILYADQNSCPFHPQSRNATTCCRSIPSFSSKNSICRWEAAVKPLLRDPGGSRRDAQAIQKVHFESLPSIRPSAVAAKLYFSFQVGRFDIWSLRHVGGREAIGLLRQIRQYSKNASADTLRISIRLPVCSQRPRESL